MAHPVYSQKTVEEIKYTHKPPEGIRDRIARGTIAGIRAGFDLVSGYDPEKLDERGWMNRIVFLETVAGVREWWISELAQRLRVRARHGSGGAVGVRFWVVRVRGGDRVRGDVRRDGGAKAGWISRDGDQHARGGRVRDERDERDGCDGCGAGERERGRRAGER